MSRRPGLAERLDQLVVALDAGRAALPSTVLTEGDELVARARERLALAGEATVVALAGATGSGKSSLFNALCGHPLAAAGATRPTTGEAAAALWAADPAAVHQLLDWLEVGVRHPLPARAADPTDLVLLDLPDHDSVEAAHRAVAERLYQRVDLLVWVVDPQKYADGVLHERYLRPLSALAPVMVLALNQADRLSVADRTACTADLARLAAADGLGAVPVLAVSARTGEGVDALRDLLRVAASRRRAATDRLTAEVVQAATGVLAACGTPDRAIGRPGGSGQTDLVRALEGAAGVPVVVDAVRRSMSGRARAATGWPPVRWIGRLRPDPLRRLHLGVGVPISPELVRTSLPEPSPAARAGAAGAVREYVDAATARVPDDWVLAVRSRVTTEGLGDELDQAVARTPLVPLRPARWWRAVAVLQWALLAVAVVGGLWLAGLPLVEQAFLVRPVTPVWGGLPVPTWLAVGGVLGGWLVAALAAAAGAWGARRRASQAGSRLHEAVVDVARRRVVDPVNAGLDLLERCRSAATRAGA
ncbi:MAG: 50S ribosome-binding GTPase [Actinobacteria bacterium]|nr:50S ribosome-binding GTPase [Actinomycetota bacterium]MCG2801313.1 50S ribosome-binding GTPase [Cellulomonas sp.]